jgi:hypothetical protein
VPGIPPACRRRLGWHSPLRYSGRFRSTIAAATTSGTAPTGSRNSIGTKTSCVGTVKPYPIGKRTWVDDFYVDPKCR